MLAGQDLLVESERDELGYLGQRVDSGSAADHDGLDRLGRFCSNEGLRYRSEDRKSLTSVDKRVTGREVWKEGGMVV